MVLQLSTSTGPSIILHSPVPVEEPYPLVTPTEEQFILRLDPELAKQVQSQINTDGYPKDLSITWTSPRTAQLKFNPTNLKRTAVLVDLPCIIEGQKTIDKKQFYKIADICQMLVVINENGQFVKEENGNEFQLFPTSLSTMKKQSYRWANGLTPPMQNVRTRRFRRKARGLTGEDVENVLQLLIEADEEAISTEYSVQEDTTVDDISDLVANIEENLMDDLREEEGEEEEGEEEGEEEEFQEQQAVYSELQDDLYQAGTIDFGIEELEEAFAIPTSTASFETLASEPEEQKEDHPAFTKVKDQSLLDEIEQLESRLAEKMMQLQVAPPNPIIRQRLTVAIEQLQTELDEKRARLEED